jgi:signal peptidase I
MKLDKKLIKKTTNIVYILTIVVLILLAAITGLTVLQGPKGLRFFVVQSGSMEPAIKTGSVVVVSPRDNYKKDDIITFSANPKVNLKDVKATVTHRIVGTSFDEGRDTFITKGDANENPDREMISETRILGKVDFSLPYLGYIVAFTKTQTGFLLLIVIPATLIIYSELVSLKKELKKLVSKWKEKSKTKKQKQQKKEKKQKK